MHKHKRIQKSGKKEEDHLEVSGIKEKQSVQFLNFLFAVYILD